MSKYYNQKIRYGDETFDSKREFNRYNELLILERAGLISDLRRQVEFELIPEQRRGKKLLERKCSYIADFVYRENGETVVEDAKGYKTEVYLIKKKLMLYVHGITIKES